MDENLEIDRGYLPAAPQKKKPLIPEFKVDMPSLREKLQDHMDFNKVLGLQSLMPDSTRVAVPLYFFTITATWCLGMFEVVPTLYRGREDSELFLQRVAMVIMYLEIMINWLCIRYVDNSYLSFLKETWTRKANSVAPQTADNPSLKNLLKTILLDASSMGNVNSQNGTHGSGNPHSSDQKEAETAHRNSQHPWKPAFRPPQQTSFPYWSWTPCYICQVMRPPRCHHCPLCQTCVLKRDHHCFFAGSCVGWRNQRHFLVFSVWSTIGCLYATFHSATFFSNELWATMRWFDLLAPVAFVRWLMGLVPGLTCFCVLLGTLLLYFFILAFYFAAEHAGLIYKGKTSFEVASLKKTLELRDVRRLGAKYRAVLGRYWLLNLLCPLHWLLDCEEDPENWPSIKVYRH